MVRKQSILKMCFCFLYFILSSFLFPLLTNRLKLVNYLSFVICKCMNKSLSLHFLVIYAIRTEVCRPPKSESRYGPSMDNTYNQNTLKVLYQKSNNQWGRLHLNYFGLNPNRARTRIIILKFIYVFSFYFCSVEVLNHEYYY